MREKMQKFKSLIKATAILFLLLFSSSGCTSAEAPSVNHEENISNYLELLKTDPKNCFYAEQIASSYQALNNPEKAIIFYQRALNLCSDNLLNHFQLGVCYYLIMERELGIQYMDKAIDQAQKAGETKMANMFSKEKKSWLEKWDLVREMNWNKNKK
jgi:tetratricopeptide (TPR) repeat protein